MLYNIVIFIMICMLFYFLNQYYKPNENYCNGNVYCNGNTDNALCINQSCLECGLQAPCKNNSECGPNLCINGCCDTM